MYSTVHHSKRRGLAWALITPVIFWGKEKQWIEKEKNQPGDPGAVGRKCGQVKASWLG